MVGDPPQVQQRHVNDAVSSAALDEPFPPQGHELLKLLVGVDVHDEVRQIRQGCLRPEGAVSRHCPICEEASDKVRSGQVRSG